MKTTLFAIAAIIAFAACQSGASGEELAKAQKDTAGYTTMQWIDSLKNIGTVEEGKTTQIQFRFKNTGSKPLFIIAAQPGCGCTVADYPKEAILPGKEGTITAGYSVHRGSAGDFRKNITVTTNTRGTTSHIIYFYGNIKKAAAKANTASATGS